MLPRVKSLHGPAAPDLTVPSPSHRLVAKIFFNDCYKVHYSRDMPTGAFGHLVNNEWKISLDVDEKIEKFKGASGEKYRRQSGA